MASTRVPQITTESEINSPPDGGPPSLLVQVPVAARMLGVGRTKIYELVNDGELELVHIGCRALVPVDSVQSFSDRLRARTAAAPASDPFGDVLRFRESPWDDSQPSRCLNCTRSQPGAVMSIHRRVGKRGNTYEVRLRGPDGHEISRSFKTERQARAFEAEQRTAMHRGGWVDPRAASTPFRAVAMRWVQSNPTKRPSTRARDDVTLRLHLLPALGDIPIGQIAPADVRALVTTWLTERKPSSVSRDYRTLAAICRFAVDQDLIVRSPCRVIKLPVSARRSVHVVDADELARLAKPMGEYGPMAYVAAVLGLRWGEVAGLKVAALDLERRTLTVSEQISRGKGGQIVLGLPKSDAGRRTLSMPTALADLLAVHLEANGRSTADGGAFGSRRRAADRSTTPTGTTACGPRRSRQRDWRASPSTTSAERMPLGSWPLAST